MKIGFFGDSFIEGVGDPDKLGWVGRLCNQLNISYVNFGRRGDTGPDIINRWQHQAQQAGVDRLVFSFGANDCLLDENKRVRVSPVDRLKNAKTIMEQARNVGPTLFVSPLPVADDRKANFRIADTARQLATIARANRVAYVNIFESVLASEVWVHEALVGDGAHPGVGGYSMIADLLAESSVWKDWVSQSKS